MKWYIKLDAENIIGHVDSRHPFFDPADYQAVVEAPRLANSKGEYIYKYVGGQLVELTEQEIENHPLKIEGEKENKFEKARELFLTRRALNDIIEYSGMPANIVTRAQNKLAKIENKIQNIIGT